MAKLLHISASPRGDRSHSLRLAAAYLAAYRDTHPRDAILEIDLWNYALPPIDAGALSAKESAYAGQAPAEEARAAWQRIEAVAHEFRSADRLLLSVPMWNFSVPYVLKHYIDIVMQPGITFSYSSKTGYQGLAQGRHAVIIQASAGAYHAGSGWEGYDLLTPYLRFWLQLVGYIDIRTVNLTHTSDPARANDAAIAQQLDRLARNSAPLPDALSA